MKHQIKVYCQQEIPCNPCAGVCVKGAIVKRNLTSLPEFKAERCVGCLLCVASCPGQALFYLNEEKCELVFPYEFSQKPGIGDEVGLVDEFGSFLGIGTIVDYLDRKTFNKTTLVVVKGKLEDLDRTRGIVRR